MTFFCPITRVNSSTTLERMKSAYEHAKSAEYRFYSYGDCMFVE